MLLLWEQVSSLVVRKKSFGRQALAFGHYFHLNLKRWRQVASTAYSRVNLNGCFNRNHYCRLSKVVCGKLPLERNISVFRNEVQLVIILQYIVMWRCIYVLPRIMPEVTDDTINWWECPNGVHAHWSWSACALSIRFWISVILFLWRILHNSTHISKVLLPHQNAVY